jgi:hypothetical protein
VCIFAAGEDGGVAYWVGPSNGWFKVLFDVNAAMPIAVHVEL